MLKIIYCPPSFIMFLDISRVREYLYKRAVHLVVVVVVQQPRIEFADLRNI